MTIVVDASLVVSALIINEPNGIWAEQVLASDELIAPQSLPAECASIIRRSELRNDITAEGAAQAYSDLLALRVGLLPFYPFARRVWELHQNVTPYDAWYIAIAEQFDLDLATFDRKLTHATGPKCRFLMP